MNLKSLICGAMVGALLQSCATDRHAAAIQQTAIGGGFVAIGTTAAAGAAVSGGAGAVALATSGVPIDPVSVLIPIGLGLAVSGGIIGLGGYLMASAAPDLVLGSAGLSSASPPKAQTTPPIAAQTAAPTAAVTPSAAVAAPTPSIAWIELSPELLAARQADGSVLLFPKSAALTAGCVYMLQAGAAAVRLSVGATSPLTLSVPPGVALPGGVAGRISGCGVDVELGASEVFNISRMVGR